MLMRRAQDGDQAAYRLILLAMLPVIRAFARRRVFDEVLLEDVVQETLLTVHKLRHTYDPERPLLPWLATITFARAIDATRRNARLQRREAADETAMYAAIDDSWDGRMEALANDNEVARLLNRLPDRQRMAVEMVKIREMSLDDAAAETRTSVSAIKSLLHRAVSSLRENGSR
ncbi:RNA polymerase sigma factor [Sphingobium sp.]|uniref:RNA polymerase sigma factor n=1 Tax=Sphingobium sp. TaxID=1912891 RepID=UPI002C2B562E|nr:sigma-70 family RNA polymerase sigma factor [Sphingobium sp.]HUD93474.1 sigma-70 family RNA polymerase sigma factor [Sphingobium sp.]